MLRFDPDYHIARIDHLFAPPTGWTEEYDPHEVSNIFLERGIEVLRIMWHSSDTNKPAIAWTAVLMPDGEWILNRGDTRAINAGLQEHHKRLTQQRDGSEEVLVQANSMEDLIAQLRGLESSNNQPTNEEGHGMYL